MNVYSSTMHRKAKNWKQSNSSISWRTEGQIVVCLRWNGMLPTPHTTLFGRMSFKVGSHALHITYLGFFCMGDILLPLCWLIQLLVSVWTPGYSTLYFVL